jgi:hypothetical protein
MNTAVNDSRAAHAWPRISLISGVALAVTLGIVWGAVHLVREGPAVDLVAGRWALANAESCGKDSVLMQVAGTRLVLFAHNAQLDGDIVWVARVDEELRLDVEPKGLPGAVYSMGFRRIAPDRLLLVSAGFLVPPQLNGEEMLRQGERFVQYGMASVGLTVRRCAKS